MEESLHNTNACYFLKSILKLANIKLEKELKKKRKNEGTKYQKETYTKVSNCCKKCFYFIWYFFKEIGILVKEYLQEKD
jgi:hypothetical protein